MHGRARMVLAGPRPAPRHRRFEGGAPDQDVQARDFRRGPGVALLACGGGRGGPAASAGGGYGGRWSANAGGASGAAGRADDGGDGLDDRRGDSRRSRGDSDRGSRGAVPRAPGGLGRVVSGRGQGSKGRAVGAAGAAWLAGSRASAACWRRAHCAAFGDRASSFHAAAVFVDSATDHGSGATSGAVRPIMVVACRHHCHVYCCSMPPP